MSLIELGNLVQEVEAVYHVFTNTDSNAKALIEELRPTAPGARLDVLEEQLAAQARAGREARAAVTGIDTDELMDELERAALNEENPHRDDAQRRAQTLRDAEVARFHADLPTLRSRRDELLLASGQLTATYGELRTLADSENAAEI